MKDYYAILGVLPSIDQVALAAVYRALLKKYHPDVFVGSPEEAHRITKELNEAYEVLGDPKGRAAYDKTRGSRDHNSGDYGSQSADESAGGVDEAIEHGWDFVIRYHPGAEQERLALAQISPNLAFHFQVVLLERKNAEEFRAVSARLKNEFLTRYFGTDTQVHDYVIAALHEGRKDVALEVNRAIKILGSPSSGNATDFLRQVSRKCEWLPPKLRAERERSAQDESAARATRACLAGGAILGLVVLVWAAIIPEHSAQNSPPTSAPAPQAVAASSLVAPHALPSFDCEKVSSRVLKLVCATPELATLDSNLAEGYALAMSKVSSPGLLRDDERAWITARNNAPADVSVLKQLYESRISVLNAIAKRPMDYLGASVAAASTVDRAVVALAAQKVWTALKEGGTIRVQAEVKACYDAATQQSWKECLAYDAAAEALLPAIEKGGNLPPTDMFVATAYRARAMAFLNTYGISDRLEQEQTLQLLDQLATEALTKNASAPITDTAR